MDDWTAPGKNDSMPPELRKAFNKYYAVLDAVNAGISEARNDGDFTSAADLGYTVSALEGFEKEIFDLNEKFESKRAAETETWRMAAAVDTERSRRYAKRTVDAEEAEEASAAEDEQGWDDLTEGWDDPPPKPAVLARTDGQRLGYLGMSHIIGGESEAGKTRLMDLATVQEVRAGRPVIRFDLENGAMLTRQALKDMGLTKEEVKGLVRYRHAKAPWSVKKAEKEAAEFAADGGYLVVLDSSTAMASALNLEVSGGRSEDVERLYTITMNPWKEAGLAVFTLDNVTKANALSFAGSQHKKSGADVGLGLVTRSPFGVGVAGWSDLYVIKDRGSAIAWEPQEGLRWAGRMQSSPITEREVAFSVIAPASINDQVQLADVVVDLDALPPGVGKALAVLPEVLAWFPEMPCKEDVIVKLKVAGAGFDTRDRGVFWHQAVKQGLVKITKKGAKHLVESA